MFDMHACWVLVRGLEYILQLPLRDLVKKCQQVLEVSSTVVCCSFGARCVVSMVNSVLLLDSPVEVKLVTDGYAMFTSSELVLFWNILTILKYVHCKRL